MNKFEKYRNQNLKKQTQEEIHTSSWFFKKCCSKEFETYCTAPYYGFVLIKPGLKTPLSELKMAYLRACRMFEEIPQKNFSQIIFNEFGLFLKDDIVYGCDTCTRQLALKPFLKPSIKISLANQPQCPYVTKWVHKAKEIAFQAKSFHGIADVKFANGHTDKNGFQVRKGTKGILLDQKALNFFPDEYSRKFRKKMKECDNILVYVKENIILVPRNYINLLD